MKTRFLPTSIALAATVAGWSLASLAAAEIEEPASIIRLWPGDAPGALGQAEKDVPTLQLYPADPARANGAALLLCPGGGYSSVSLRHEGSRYATFFKKEGISCFVLNYRVGPSGYHHPVMLQDAARAMRLIRSKAAEWKLDPRRIGICGASAGGHLASTLLTHFDAGNPASPDPVERESSRPDLGILCYAVITMGEFTHPGSRKNLLGPNPSPESIRELSNELHVTAQTPPCFIWQTLEDPAIPVENSVNFAVALRKAGVPFDLHVYQKGGHALGILPRHPWLQDVLYWLDAQSFTGPSKLQPPSRPSPTP